MNERERWIIYPLLFFALGSALRDKFTQQVTTDRLFAGKIVCEEISVIDSEKPDRIVAQLTSNPPQRGKPNAERYGVFILRDSEDKELCGVTNNQLQVSRIACNAVTVLDPKDPNRVLAILSAAEAAKPDGTTRRLGSLLLTDSDGVRQFGLADDQLVMRQVICEGLAVVNPENSGQVLAALGSVPVKPDKEGDKAERFGVLALNNEQFGSLHGNPPKRPLENQAPKEPAPEDEEAAEEGKEESKSSPAPDAANEDESSAEPAKTPADAAEGPSDKA
jgi:hypothetical protein